MKCKLCNDLDANNDILMETTHLKLSNADLLNNEIGIYVWDDSRADILVTNNSLIDGNAYGIKAVGGLSPAFVVAGGRERIGGE